MTKKITNTDITDVIVEDEKKEVNTEVESERQSATEVLPEVLINKIETVVYCGPTIKGVVLQYAHFINGIPKRLKEYSESNKSVKRLIVPIEKFVETKKNINLKGTIENISYNKIQKGE